MLKASTNHVISLVSETLDTHPFSLKLFDVKHVIFSNLSVLKQHKIMSIAMQIIKKIS